MSDTFHGGCACGAIQYECTAEPVFSFNCHCRACQRFTGSAFISGIAVPAAAFKLTRGEAKYYITRGDSGGEVRRGLCANWGSPVVARLSRMPDMIAIPAGSLDQSSRDQHAVDLFV